MAFDGRGSYVFSAYGVFLCFLLNQFVLCGSQTLRMVNVVYRHGDRSPVHFFSKDTHKNYWPQGLGQLTQIGMRQEYELGKFLKRRYIDGYKLLNSSYLFKEIYCRSSDRDRCIMSAQTQLNGLYPPHGKQVWRENLDWQPIGIHVVPKNEDYLLRPLDYPCPRLKKLEEQSKQDSEYKKIAEEYKDVVEYVSAHAGQTLNMTNIHQIWDTLFCEKSHNLTLPAWATNGTTMEALKNLSYFNMKWLFSSHEKQRLTGGNLVGAMVNNMRRFLVPHSGDNIIRKIYIYSAHDTTVSALLSALKIYNGITPAYSSAVMIELFSDEENEKDNLTVRIMYRFGQSDVPRTLKLPNCTDYCPLDDFIQKAVRFVSKRGQLLPRFHSRACQTADVIPKDLLKECDLGGGDKCVTTLIYKSFLAAFLVVAVTLACLVTCLCIVCCRRRWRRRQAKLGIVYNDLLKDARLLDKSDYDSDS